MDTPTAIKGEYIVVFKREMQDDDSMLLCNCMYMDLQVALQAII